MHCSQQCFWETRQIGCQRKSCGFYHILPRNIQGLFIPPTSDLQVRTDTTHHMPLPVSVHFMEDDEEEGEEEGELGDSRYFILDKMEERVKTQDEEEEEKAIIAVCRSAGDIFKISPCEENGKHEEETPEGGGNTTQETPTNEVEKTTARQDEKGHEGPESNDNNKASVQLNERDASKNPPRPHDPPSKHERSYWKEPQHYHRGDYRKDGPRWRKKYWYADFDPHYQGDKGYYDNYQPCRRPYKKGWRKTFDENHGEKHSGDYKPADQGRSNRPQNSNDHQQVDNKHHDNYCPGRKPSRKGWRRTYSNEDKNIGYNQFNQKRRSGEKKKAFNPHYEQDQSSDNYYSAKKLSGRSRRKTNITSEKNNEKYQPYRKTYAETNHKDKAVEKNTGHKQNLGNASSKEKNKDTTSVPKTQSAPRQPVTRKIEDTKMQT